MRGESHRARLFGWFGARVKPRARGARNEPGPRAVASRDGAFFAPVARMNWPRYDAVHGEGAETLVIARWWSGARPRERAWVVALLALGAFGMAFRFWL